MSKCPYIDECGSPCDCNKENPDCRIRELFDDYYKLEKLYQDAEKKYNVASFIAKNLQKRCRHLTRRNAKLNKVKDILLNQLVVLDGECVTVQITQKQFEEYNKLEIKNDELKEELHKSREYNLAIIKQGHEATQKLERIKEIIKECNKHDYDLCCTCKYADNCRKEDYNSYDVTKFILEIIEDAKQ